MSIQQQQGDLERRAQEESAQAEQDKINAYADYHHKRGTGTSRAWEHGGDYPGADAFVLGSYYSDAAAPKQEKENNK